MNNSSGEKLSRGAWCLQIAARLAILRENIQREHELLSDSTELIRQDRERL